MTTALFTVIFLSNLSGSVKTCHAAAVSYVRTLGELEQALRASGERTIYLKADITVSRCLKVKGSKLLHGGGTYRIRRRTAAGNVYKGTLLQMQGRQLTIRDLTLNGGKSGDVNGKLIEIDTGTVCLENGAKLAANYNVSSFTDGGGGITVHAGGTAVLKPGSAIRDNISLTGGSAVRVETGGMFVMEGGTIADNAVLGQRKDSDFDGRGGAIHNRGIVFLQGGTITGNTAVGYEKGVERHGGYGGAVFNKGVLTISGGMIVNNKASFAGGAVYATADSVLNMNGGEMTGNAATNERGGGIYMSAGANVNVNGGRIADNFAADGTQIFLASNAAGKLIIGNGSISGSGDVIYNNGGRMSVLGGKIQSRDCAVKTKGECEIRGGIVSGGTYGIRYADGWLALSGQAAVNSVYLAENRVIETDGKLSLRSPCELCPETYRERKKLVHISSGESPSSVLSSFTLRKRKRFLLETGSGGLYIGREKYVIVFRANGGQGNMEEQQVYVGRKAVLRVCKFRREGYGFVGWARAPGTVRRPKEITFKEGAEVRDLGQNGERVDLYALWVKKPELTDRYGDMELYEGEYADRQVLLAGMGASDECDGDLTEKIEIVTVCLPDRTMIHPVDVLPTEGSQLAEGFHPAEGSQRVEGSESTQENRAFIGKGEIVYRVVNTFGIESEYRRRYEVIPNKAPEIVMRDRYFFAGEYAPDRMDQAKQDILSHMRMRDDVESESQLERNRTVLWGGLDMQTEGEYLVAVRVKDQYGHRFYMPDGVERQYGTGKVYEKKINVHVVKRENDCEKTGQIGFVRFISPEYKDTLEDDSIWRTGSYAAELAHSLQMDGSRCDEVWTITGDDKKKIRAFMREREDPFSKETNDLFQQRFSYMKTKGADVK